MAVVRTILLGAVATLAIACGIDALGVQPLVDLPDGSSSSSSSSSSSGSGGDDGGVDPENDAATPTDASTDAIVDAAPDVAPLVPPYLNLEHAPAPATIDLTAEGTKEWAYWGVNGNPSSIRNAGAPNIISLVTLVGSSFGSNTGLGATLTWSNGPTGNVTGSYDWYRSINPAGMTASATVHAPSGPVKQTFVVVVGGANLRGRLTASLSDGSVTAKVDNTYANLAGSFSAKYVFEYATVGVAQIDVKWEVDAVATAPELRFTAAALR